MISYLLIKGSVATRNQTDLLDLWNLGTNNSWFLGQTNYDRWKEPLPIDDRRTPIYDCMNENGREVLF